MARPQPRQQLARYLLLAALVAVLAFPGLVFPHPGTNDAIGLADAEWPLVGLEVAGAIFVYARFQGAVGTRLRAGVGALLLGAAIALVVGLIVFGNLSNDRFAALLVFPPVLAFIGLAGIGIAAAAGIQHRPELLRGTAYGLAFAVGFGAWTLVRGARAWLLAPYGFDLLLLLAVLGAGLVLFLISPRANPGG